MQTDITKTYPNFLFNAQMLQMFITSDCTVKDGRLTIAQEYTVQSKGINISFQ